MSRLLRKLAQARWQDVLAANERVSKFGTPAWAFRRAKKEVFEEFRHLSKDAPGETKAIVQGISKFLGHEISVRLWPSKGSWFSITLRLAEPGEKSAQIKAVAAKTSGNLRGMTAIIIENDLQILEGMAELPESAQSKGCSDSLGRRSDGGNGEYGQAAGCDLGGLSPWSRHRYWRNQDDAKGEPATDPCYRHRNQLPTRSGNTNCGREGRAPSKAD
jgi:hypothetical protein